MTPAKTWMGGCAALLLSGSVFSAPPPFGTPPPEAKAACAKIADGAPCRFDAPDRTLTGTCRATPGGRACVPAGMGAASDIASTSGMGAPPGMGGSGGGNRPRPPTVTIAAHDPSARAVTSRIPDTGQGSCFDDRGLIPCPAPGERWYGQDAQYEGALPDYRVNGNGTITDRITGLTWQQRHNDERLNWGDARATCAALRLGGHDDWRLPTIKELFSIADFRGAVGRRPYLPEVFEIREPDASILEDDPFRATHRTEMMGQTWSATIYAGDHWDRPGVKGAFFMNFLDGRIKSAPVASTRNRLFYRCVRGPEWGANDFVDNRDGTVTDRASGLTWQQADDGQARDWEGALAYCATLTLAGRHDWRLPNVKELQSIVDYTRNNPAIDARYFRQSDSRGWFWSSTTLGDAVTQATYVCFGKCTSIEGVDVHGAGAMRSDPKSAAVMRGSFQGGQEDEVRGRNYARCVRSP